MTGFQLQRSARGGFTLVEVLLAMGLLVVVMAGVYAGMETFRRVTTMGRDGSSERQLARAVRSRLLTDVRSLRFAPPVAAPDETPADDSETSADGSDGESSSSSADPAEEDGSGDLTPVPRVGLAGDATVLTLYTTLPDRGAPGALPRVGDLRTVTWFLSGQGGAAVSSAVAERDGPGLVRSEADTPTLTAADETGDVATLLAAAETLAPEVTALSFRYFDGVDWLDAWDSSESGALPRAVEATVQFDLDGPPNPYAPNEAGDRPPTVCRIVVCPPLSEPDAEAGL